MTKREAGRGSENEAVRVEGDASGKGADLSRGKSTNMSKMRSGAKVNARLRKLNGEVVPKSWCVYILRCSDRSLYCGITNDLPRRLLQHNRGTGARYTRGRGPVKVLHTWTVAGKSSALKAEIAFKRLTRSAKLAFIKKSKPGKRSPSAVSARRSKGQLSPRKSAD